MAIEMFFQQKLYYGQYQLQPGSSTAKDDVDYNANNVRSYFFYRMPSGLVLYWFLNSSLALVYQIRSRLPVANIN